MGGGTGILYDGAQVYSAFAGTTALIDYASSATALEGDTFDQCGEHAASTFMASYHAHVPPSCLLHQLNATTTAHSPQIGWNLDGFPIYGPRGPSGKMMRTCTSEGITDSPSTPCVDACVGRASTIQPNDGYTYRYYILGEYGDGTTCTTPTTPLSTSAYYPFTPLCYKGCCPSGVTCSEKVTACPTSGTTMGYTTVLPAQASLPINSEACKIEYTGTGTNTIVVVGLCVAGAVLLLIGIGFFFCCYEVQDADAKGTEFQEMA